jgi:hypothetical protein
MEVWGPFDWLAFLLVAIPAAQMAIDNWMARKDKAPGLRRSALWSRAPAVCICAAAVLALIDHLGFLEPAHGHHHTRIEVGPGAQVRGPVTIYDEAGRTLISVPENGEMVAPQPAR